MKLSEILLNEAPPKVDLSKSIGNVNKFLDNTSDALKNANVNRVTTITNKLDDLFRNKKIDINSLYDANGIKPLDSNLIKTYFKDEIEEIADSLALQFYKKNSFDALTPEQKRTISSRSVEILQKNVNSSLTQLRNKYGKTLNAAKTGSGDVEKYTELIQNIDGFKDVVKKLTKQDIAMMVEAVRKSKVTSSSSVSPKSYLADRYGKIKSLATSGMNLPKRLYKVTMTKGLTRRLSTIGALGLIGAIAYNMLGADGVAIEDETSNSDWMPCIQNLLNTKEGKIGKSPSGQISVVVKNQDYPNGIQFFSNGRVYDPGTGRKGTYTCQQGQIVQESEIKNIVKRHLEEQITNSEINQDVSDMIDYLDFPIYGDDLKNAYNLMLKYSRKPDGGKQFLEKYKKSGLMSGGLGDLGTTLKFILKRNPETVDIVEAMQRLYAQMTTGNPTQTGGTGSSNGLRDISISWDVKRPQNGNNNPSTSTPKKPVIYHDCSQKGFPYEYGCKGVSKIADIQECLGVTPIKGYFGNKTKKALIDAGYDISNGITEEMYYAIMDNCNQTNPTETGSDQVDMPTDNTTQPDPNQVNQPVPNPLVQLPEVKPKNLSSEAEKGKMIYDDAVSKGFFDSGKIGQWRVKYKGNDLDKSTFNSLDAYMTSIGYTLIKKKNKGKQYNGGENDKYVWQFIR